LLKALRHEDGVSPMPPKTPRDRAREEAFAAWIKRGAPWPRTVVFKGEKHWAYEPLRDPPGSIDSFIDAGLRKKGYAALGPADRRTLLRRAAFDLTGLPPTMAGIEAFLADKSPDAWEKAIDRLLSSPAYGERWGRHWLDVARYADTAGENTDHPVPHAWRYRNWVIGAFNEDLPYDAFVKSQLAGDLLPEKRIVATGFLAIARRFGHDIDKDMHLTIEDALDTTGKAFLGLGLGCARCHSHKYDPITAEDYYALYGILASTKFSFPGCEPQQQPRDLVPLPGTMDDPAPLRAAIAGKESAFKRIVEEQEKAAKGRKAHAGRVLGSGLVPDGGKHAFSVAKAVKVKKGELLMLSVTPGADHGADSTLVEWKIADGKKAWDLAEAMKDFDKGNPRGPWHFLDARDGLRPLPEVVRDFSGHKGLHVWRNGDTPSVFANVSENTIPVWARLAPRSVFMHPAADGAVSIGWLSPVDAEVTMEGRLEDVHPGGTDGVGWWLQHFAADFSSLDKDAERAAAMRKLTAERAALLAKLTAVPLAYAVSEGTPKDVRVQLRGDPEKPGKEVPRGWLSRFGGDRVKGPGSGRLELAERIMAQPLAARVMANRVWHWHFGKGLVKTPNDFGARGLPPTHPGLLDSLASGLARSGWSLKALHRRIMLSEAYRRASAGKAVEDDPANDSYWRFDPRRLSAEELRDSLLAVGGNLDRSPGGPHPFPDPSTWQFTQHNPFSASYPTDRRSVYLMTLRNRRHPFLGLFDGADPNASTPDRQSTTVPTQALWFMNDPFFHAQAARLAARTKGVEEMYRLALQRAPAEKEKERARRFLDRYAKATDEAKARAAFARVLLAGNEFLHAD
ncbi:MAG: DUF1549 and DUF1553 domain-containing protein, partial [Gemmataceae bacterium]|nr:DUF1549 and DUF1553 domain-containing protein [Gemmataceae bacterium]